MEDSEALVQDDEVMVEEVDLVQDVLVRVAEVDLVLVKEVKEIMEVKVVKDNHKQHTVQEEVMHMLCTREVEMMKEVSHTQNMMVMEARKEDGLVVVKVQDVLETEVVVDLVQGVLDKEVVVDLVQDEVVKVKVVAKVKLMHHHHIHNTYSWL